MLLNNLLITAGNSGNSKLKAKIEPYLDDIYKKLEWLSREDLIKHFVSAEFNRFLEYYKNSNNINNKGVKSRSDSKFKNGKSNRNSFVNYSISIGRKKGISPIELISLIKCKK